ncbi:MAG TPA: N-acetylmuramoyl-L-alanine amidase [Vicinamibacterales bacterium]
MKPVVAVVAAALCLISAALPAQQSAALPYTVVTHEGKRPLAVRTISGQEMFALDDLARLFNLNVREDPAAASLTIAAGPQTILLSTQQPLASIGGRMTSLPSAPVRDGKIWYVPVDFVGRVLATVSAVKMDLRKPSRLLLVGDVRMPRVAARVEPLGSETRVTIDVAPATPHTVAQEGSRLVVRFDADALDAPDLHASTTTDMVQGVRLGDTAQTIAIDLGPRFASFRAADQPGASGAGRIAIDLLPQVEAAPTVTPGQAPPPPETPPLLDLPPPGGLRTIVIDPGHGGDDLGARGVQGTLEKTVTLAIARRVKAALEARLGTRVLLTRDSDQAVGLDQRAAVANNNKADLFVSLHANASLRPGQIGAEVFYLAIEGYGEAAQRAAQAPREALPLLGGGTRDIEIIPWELAQARYIDQAAAFARAIEGALQERVKMTPQALQQGPFRVLVGANMPAVLIELGFLSNSQEEQQLLADDHQAALAQAVVEGIVRYRAGASR